MHCGTLYAVSTGRETMAPRLSARFLCQSGCSLRIHHPPKHCCGHCSTFTTTADHMASQIRSTTKERFDIRVSLWNHVSALFPSPGGFAVKADLDSSPVIASCVRTALFFINIQRGLNDVTWTSVESISLTNAEPGMIVIAACLPILRPLFTVLQAKLAEVSAPWSRTRSRSSSALDRSSGGSEEPRKFAHYIALDEIGGTKIGSNTSTSYSSQAAIR